MIATDMRESGGSTKVVPGSSIWFRSLRYGRIRTSRPSSTAAANRVPYSLAYARQLNGKEMSYNTIRIPNAALAIVREFDEPFCVGLKHMNPCGAAVGRMRRILDSAYEADKVSIFRRYRRPNRPVTREAAELMKPDF